MMACVFCDIAAGLVPAIVVSRSSRAIAFLPKDGLLAPGHSLVAPVAHSTDLDDLETSRFAPLSALVDALGAHAVERFEIPHDFTDGFQAAFWRRPEMYLDPGVRAASSTFASLRPELVEPGIERLRSDLRTGKWHETYRELLALDSADFGHRIVIAG